MPIRAVDKLPTSKCPKWPLSPCCAHVFGRACGPDTDGVATPVERKWTSRRRGRALDDVDSRWISEEAQDVLDGREGRACSACWLCTLGFKVGQLKPGSSRAAWTPLVAVWDGVSEEPPGSRGCQAHAIPVWITNQACLQRGKLHILFWENCFV